jgi:glycosyltransferase involved in cell wall biosynthesis
MNILYLHRTQGKGVEGVHIREMALALSSTGNNVDILSPAGLNTFNEEARINSKVHNAISKFLPEIFFEIIEIIYAFVAYKKIPKILQNKKYDLIYERYSIFNWAGIRSARMFSIPIILEINYTSFMPLYRKRSSILKPLAHIMDRMIFRSADGFIAVSTYLKNHLISLGVDREKIIVLTNAADPKKFDSDIEGYHVRKKLGFDKKKVVGFVGGFYPWHGLDMLLDSFKEIKKEFNHAVLLLIGDGPLRGKLEQKIKGGTIEKDVVFLGVIPQESLPEYISAFDIAVMPDSNEYGSPMKIFEYMAMAKPVIAPRLVPLVDAITDGREGLLFNQRDSGEFCKTLKKLLSDDKLRLEMGILGRKKILLEHTWQINAARALEFFKSIKKDM